VGKGVAMSFYPVKVEQGSDRLLKIIWNDGKEQSIDTVTMRRNCPCASCTDEMTGKRILDPKSVSESVRPVEVKSVGQYAINISFSDGHRTGFYSFSKLRQFQN
jgi:DUF971 family protein